MSRSKIIFPPTTPIFSTQIPVQITDLNYGNHVGNDKMLSIIHEARVRFLKANNMSELDVDGASLIMGESLVLYKGEGFYGDIFNIDIWADDISTASFDLLYQITTQRNEQAINIAHAKTVMICFDYEARKTKAITPKLLQTLDANNK